MSAGTHPGEGTTILVADDDAGVRALVSVLLRRAGYEVLQATNGREAVEAVREHPQDLDVVLLDVMMPEMSGYDALPALRSLRPDLPVVFFSGFDQNAVADHLVGTTAYTSFMPKPFENDDLVAEVQRAADHTG